MQGANVIITQEGRSGSVSYEEGGKRISGWWEFGGGDVITIVSMGERSQWEKAYPWAMERRGDILRNVADEVIRQKASGCVAEIGYDDGSITIRRGNGAPRPTPRTAGPTAWYGRYRDLKVKLAVLVGAIALIFGGVVWLKDEFLVIDPGPGTPLGDAVRTEQHVAILLQTLEAYTPSLHRDHSKDRYSVGMLLIPLDGSAPRKVPIREGFEGNSFSLARILGSDGRTLWFDVNGTGGVDLRTYEVVQGEPRDPRGLQGGRALPFQPRIDAHLASGLCVDEHTWLGLLSVPELEKEYAPGKWVRKIADANDARQLRRLQRSLLGDSATTGSRRIISMDPIGKEEFLNASFLRMDERSEPIRPSEPDGALMLYTSEPGLKGTLVMARVDMEGRIIWHVDTAIDRFKLQRILPGGQVTAFMGTRLPVPGKVSEPILVLVDHASGKAVTHSLWR